MTSLALMSICRVASAGSEKSCESEMRKAAAEYRIPLAVLYAIGLSETGQKGLLRPYALNFGGPSYLAKDLADALARFKEAEKRGAKLIDIGCMQIDYYYHSSRFDSVESMFDPRANVRYAAEFLRKLYDREKSWTLAAAYYHAGPGNDAEQKRYVCRVVSNMVASGFGSWTSDARTFCVLAQQLPRP